MTNKTQEAALKRISQIEDKMKEYFKKESMMSSIEIDFEHCLREINELIDEHNLSKDLSESFIKQFTNLIYDKAIKLKDFSWATKFAAKHKM